MTTTPHPIIDIGAEVAQGIYANATFEAQEVQPLFVLHRDTVKSYFHEKRTQFDEQGKLLGYLGVEITLVATLLTATFNDQYGMKGTLIQAVFFVFSIIFGLLLVASLVNWRKHKETLTVENMVDDLGKRGSIIKPALKTESN